MNTQLHFRNLLDQQKISQAEYEILVKSINQEKKQLFIRILYFLINPYKNISPVLCLGSGIALIFALSYIGHKTFMNFSGFMSVDYKPGKPFAYLLILKNLSIIWISISLAFFCISKILGNYKLRAIDFFAYCGLAKFPYFIAMLLDAISYQIDPRLLDDNHNKQGLFVNIYGSILDTIVVLMIFWHIILYFFAFKEASGLNHQRTWLGYVIAMVLVHSILTVWLNPSLQ